MVMVDLGSLHFFLLVGFSDFCWSLELRLLAVFLSFSIFSLVISSFGYLAGFSSELGVLVLLLAGIAGVSGFHFSLCCCLVLGFQLQFWIILDGFSVFLAVGNVFLKLPWSSWFFCLLLGRICWEFWAFFAGPFNCLLFGLFLLGILGSIFGRHIFRPVQQVFIGLSTPFLTSISSKFAGSVAETSQVMRDTDLSPRQPLQSNPPFGTLDVIGRRSVSDLGAIDWQISATNGMGVWYGPYGAKLPSPSEESTQE
ncbi:CCR4-NOT transcription complex subunit 3 isoform X1 [Olea europaea subsp. europaea]|uniref:CCR4-NOT transcription complex subunit 3 isoform X1 n=1 Tax=Olea europaea subsp. europaea TaxID=158383 RepID=A0A8S0PLU6_OLEEU|nr:CCR4-NOT transcription complex subunit 3 isoform X1 [Olea europaea subsp. europaea]